MAETYHHRKQLAVLPMSGKFGEILIEHVIKRIVGGVHLLDIAGCVQLLHELAIRQDDVIGAGGRLRDQPQHIVTAGIIFRLELDVVGCLEFGNDVRLAMAVPGQHVDLGRRGPGPRNEGGRQRCRRTICQRLAP